MSKGFNLKNAKHFRDRFAAFLDNDYHPVRILDPMAGISARKRSEAERETLSMAVEQATESIMITDADGTITYVNPSFEKVTGYTREEVIGQNPRIMKSGKQRPEVYEAMWQTLAQGKTWSGCMINKRKDGTLWEEETIISPVLDKDGVLRHYIGVKRDLTERNRSVAETARLSTEVANQKQQLESIVKNVQGVVWEASGKTDEAA